MLDFASDVSTIEVYWEWRTPGGQVWENENGMLGYEGDVWEICKQASIPSDTNHYGWWRADFTIESVDFSTAGKETEYPNETYTRYFRVYPANSNNVCRLFIL
ncbi:MAG: hypothetical protein U9Q85_03955 [Patescibacteria group bacterium]|nr:hypothetical protein [Patescibacteria group bacterium]